MFLVNVTSLYFMHCIHVYRIYKFVLGFSLWFWMVFLHLYEYVYERMVINQLFDINYDKLLKNRSTLCTAGVLFFLYILHNGGGLLKLNVDVLITELITKSLLSDIKRFKRLKKYCISLNIIYEYDLSRLRRLSFISYNTCPLFFARSTLHLSYTKH